MNTQFDTLIKEKFVRSLNHYTSSVTGVILTSTGTAMLHIFKNCKRIRNILVAFMSFNIGYKTNSTGIMFESGIVQPCHSFFYSHTRFSLYYSKNIRQAIGLKLRRNRQ